MVVPTLTVGETHIIRDVGVNAQGVPQVDLFVLGDTGSGSQDQYDVAAAMDAYCSQQPKAIDGVLLLGDNFYHIGVASVEDPQWQSKFERPYRRGCLTPLPFYAILGNHDYRQDPTPQIAYTAKSEQWTMPARNYRIDFGEIVTLAMMDSGFPDFCFISPACSVDFIRATLDDSQAVWKTVAAHHPVQTLSTKPWGHRGDGIFGWAMRTFSCQRADLWLSGHSHHLEYRDFEDCRLRAVVAGGGGGTLDQIRQPADTQVRFAASRHGFVHLQWTAQHMTVKFLGKKAELLFESQRQRADSPLE